MTGRRLALVATGVAAANLLFAPSQTIGATSAPAGLAQFEPGVGAFGYALGEERRYELGPERLLDRGQRVAWTIRLDRFETEGPAPLAVFALTYEDEVVGLGVAERQLDWVRSEAELTVNRWGFPLRIAMTEQDGISSRVSPFQGAPRSTTYLFDGDDRFEKLSSVEDREWSIDIPISRHDGLDLDVPRGLWVFEPSRVDIFANPGLLDLMLPRPVARSPERRDVLLLKASGTDRFWDPFADRNGREALRTFYTHAHVERHERERILVGDRRVDAWRVEIGGSGQVAWVDSQGRVVRLDVDDNPLGEPIWIRLIPASEY